MQRPVALKERRINDFPAKIRTPTQQRVSPGFTQRKIIARRKEEAKKRKKRQKEEEKRAALLSLQQDSRVRKKNSNYFY